MPDNQPFISVKLPTALVAHARDAAETMRRSVASQIEYWATLGRALEQAGLTTADSRALIARQERSPYSVSAAAGALSPELEELDAHVLALAKSGALAERAHNAVTKKAKASKNKTRKAA
jgi:hypothetical protein